MSRRPPHPSAERAAQNQQTLKTLVKIESNKSCADCKRNKQPRWASWNLGIFVCIRCSGIHRGLGTHISRVKSVDLDAWTDEQVQNMLRWGNARANKYWEAKLAPGHIPQEAKIENFIRTKYDSRRWVMDGPMPDPSTLDAGADDETPLNIVQEKAKIERSASLKAASASTTMQPPPIRRPEPQVDLFADDLVSAPTRSQAAASNTTPSSKTNVPAPKGPSKTGDSLLGFDFFGPSATTPPARPSSASANLSSNISSRPDLKQSILSLYASAPRNPAPPQPQAATNQSISPQPTQSSFGSLASDFSSLSFGSPPPTQMSPPAAPRTADLFGPSSSVSPPATSTSRPVSGGGFFDPKPPAKPAPKSGPSTSYPTSMPAFNASAAPQQGPSSPGGWGDFASASPASPKPPPISSANALGDLFGFSEPSAKPVPSPAPAPAPVRASPPVLNSPFNLSAQPAAQRSPPKPVAQTTTLTSNGSALANMDAWGSNDAWADTHPAPPTSPPAKGSATVAQSSSDWGWGNEPSVGASKGPPQVTADEDFGGWESSAASPTVSRPQASNPPPPPPPKPMGGFGTSEDLYSNVWGE